MAGLVLQEFHSSVQILRVSNKAPCGTLQSTAFLLVHYRLFCWQACAQIQARFCFDRLRLQQTRESEYYGGNIPSGIFLRGDFVRYTLRQLQLQADCSSLHQHSAQHADKYVMACESYAPLLALKLIAYRLLFRRVQAWMSVR